MLQSEVDSLRSQLGSGSRGSQSAAEIQLQQMSVALTKSHRDREELMGYITKLSQQRMSEENNNNNNNNNNGMDHTRNLNRFDGSSNNNNNNNGSSNNSNNNNLGGYQQHQHISSNGTYIH